MNASGRTCPMCGGSRTQGPAFPYATRWNGKTFSYLACDICGTTYVDPVPDDTDLASMYAAENYYDVHYGEFRTASCRTFELLAGRAARGASLLDYGCGNGAFLLGAKAAGFACTGVEYGSEVAQRAAANAGVQVHDAADFARTGDEFDVIHLGDVLEHLADPLGAMRMLLARLSPGGALVVEGPLETNPSLVRWAAAAIKRVRRLVPGGREPGVHAPAHLFMTNAVAQKLFFTERLGLACRHFETWETAWPYLHDGPRGGGAADIVRRSLGHAAVLASRVVPGLGNRFIGVFERPS